LLYNRSGKIIKIFITNLNIYTFKYNKSKKEAALEEEEEVGRRWDRGGHLVGIHI
jgi:hypothetical protein